MLFNIGRYRLIYLQKYEVTNCRYIMPIICGIKIDKTKICQIFDLKKGQFFHTILFIFMWL